MILDSHVHFWDPNARRYAWLDAHPALERRFGPEDYPAGRHDVTGLIFVQADCRDEGALDEAHWVADLARSDTRIRGIVGYAPVHMGSRAQAAIASLAALGRVVGVRRLLQDEPESLLRDPRLAEGVRLLAAHSLPFDLCVRQNQLVGVRTLIEACPDVTFVLDHLGKPAVASDALDPWRENVAAIARCGQVFCKLSGLATEASPGWRAADFRPYLDHALEVFGPYRCMVGSDWPVSSLAITIDAWFDLVSDALTGFSTAERDAVLHGTACSVYGTSRAN